MLKIIIMILLLKNKSTLKYEDKTHKTCKYQNQLFVVTIKKQKVFHYWQVFKKSRNP